MGQNALLHELDEIFDNTLVCTIYLAFFWLDMIENHWPGSLQRNKNSPTTIFKDHQLGHHNWFVLWLSKTIL